MVCPSLYTAATLRAATNGRHKFFLIFFAFGARFSVSGPTDSFLRTRAQFYGKESCLPAGRQKKSSKRSVKRMNQKETSFAPGVQFCFVESDSTSGCGCLFLAVEVPRLAPSIVLRDSSSITFRPAVLNEDRKLCLCRKFSREFSFLINGGIVH